MGNYKSRPTQTCTGNYSYIFKCNIVSVGIIYS